MAKTRHSDTGYVSLVSLAGVKGRPNSPLLLYDELFTVTNTANSMLVEANPRRVWALIVNNHDNQPAIIYLGDASSGFEQFRLQPHGSFLVSSLNPWCGAILAGTPTSSTILHVTEAVLE